MKTKILTLLLCLTALCATAGNTSHTPNFSMTLATWNPHFVKVFVADSIATDTVASDTTQAKKRDAGIEAPINFVAKDSMVYDAKAGLA